MRTIRILVLFATVLLICSMTSCSEASFDEVVEVSTNPSDTILRSAPLQFHFTVERFGAEEQTRATELQWQDGAVVYLQFHAGSSLVRGYAVYSKSKKSWVLYYHGQLSGNGQCEVYFFDGASTNDKRSVAITSNTPVYADKTANYIATESVITLTAYLTPMTGRVCFKGQSGMNISVNGLTTITGYNAETNTFVTSSNNVNRIVASTGYTPYVYATFTDAATRQLSISNSIDGDELLFSKAFASNVLQKGKSGYITIPTENTNQGWTVTETASESKRIFSVTGNGQTVQFTMIRVEPGTFEMGNYNDGSKQPNSHSVTLTKAYYMGQTEVTQALWYAVMGQKPTSDGSQWSGTYGMGDDYPAYYISWDDCQAFITKLNRLTGQQFRMPTEAEWEFAAKGGKKSKGYTYAGSNTIGDVAWYSVNSYDLGSSDPNYGTHPVAQKAPNELGLYDMSGNVWEWCADWYASNYSSGAQTNPTGPTTGSSRVLRGSSWFGNAANCRTANRSIYAPGSRNSDLGFRLAL